MLPSRRQPESPEHLQLYSDAHLLELARAYADMLEEVCEDEGIRVQRDLDCGAWLRLIRRELRAREGAIAPRAADVLA